MDTTRLFNSLRFGCHVITGAAGLVGLAVLAQIALRPEKPLSAAVITSVYGFGVAYLITAKITAAILLVRNPTLDLGSLIAIRLTMATAAAMVIVLAGDAALAGQRTVLAGIAAGGFLTAARRLGINPNASSRPLEHTDQLRLRLVAGRSNP